MILFVNLRHLEAHAVQLKGELDAKELDFGVQDEMIRAERPLRYNLTVEKLHDALLVTGSLQLVLDCQCVRCLKHFEQKVILDDWTCHAPLAGEDKVPVSNDCVDLTPFVREDILLEFPPHPLCSPECGGIAKGKALKTGGRDVSTPSAWSELDKLKL
jgi:DUF177 domain-containing protein